MGVGVIIAKTMDVAMGVASIAGGVVFIMTRMVIHTSRMTEGPMKRAVAMARIMPVVVPIAMMRRIAEGKIYSEMNVVFQISFG